jgi:two-component system catabolic regulation response regulator CreB
MRRMDGKHENSAVPSPMLLLVVDDPAIAQTASDALEREALRVRHVMLVGDAKALLAGSGADDAAVIIDIGRPDGRGLDLCRDLRRVSTVCWRRPKTEN